MAKRIGILVLGFVLSVLLLLTGESVPEGLGLLLMGVLFGWMGLLQRKQAQRDYERDVVRYTAQTTMTIVHLDEEVLESWDDDRKQTVQETFYLPTYEYSVNGQNYQYKSRQSVSGSHIIGRQVPGYYDPKNPAHITENKPRKPIFGGFLLFVFAAFLLWFGFMMIADEMMWF